MKKSILICLCMMLVLCLCSCTTSRTDLKSPVSFHYPRKEFTFNEPDSVIASEQREGAGHTEDLEYLLTLYLSGPQSADLRTPFPAGTRLVRLEQNEQCLIITLNSNFSRLSGIDLTIACACLAKTCLGLTDAASIQISAENSTLDGERAITMDHQTLILIDEAVAVTTQPSETQEDK